MPKYTQPRKTWRYTKEFKLKAVKLSYLDGIQVQQVAEGFEMTQEYKIIKADKNIIRIEYNDTELGLTHKNMIFSSDCYSVEVN